MTPPPLGLSLTASQWRPSGLGIKELLFFSSCEHPLLLASWWTPDLSSGRDVEGHLDLTAFSLLLEPWSAQFP